MKLFNNLVVELCEMWVHVWYKMHLVKKYFTNCTKQTSSCYFCLRQLAIVSSTFPTTATVHVLTLMVQHTTTIHDCLSHNDTTLASHKCPAIGEQINCNIIIHVVVFKVWKVVIRYSVAIVQPAKKTPLILISFTYNKMLKIKTKLCDLHISIIKLW